MHALRFLVFLLFFLKFAEKKKNQMFALVILIPLYLILIQKNGIVQANN